MTPQERLQESLPNEVIAEIREVIDRQYRGVIQNHDRVKALRDRLHTTSELR